MRPLHCVPYSITLSNVPQSICDIIIPANTWAQYKRMVISIPFRLIRRAPIPAPDVQYFEGYMVQGFSNVLRGAGSNVAAASTDTQYLISRAFITDTVVQPHETNWDTLGVGTIGQEQGVDHFLRLVPPAGAFDNTIQNILSLTIYNNDPTTNDLAQCSAAQAYIQAPLDLNRFPQ